MGDDTLKIRRMTATEVLNEAGIDHPSQVQARECGAILRGKFGPPKKSSGIFRWELPLRKPADDKDLDVPPIFPAVPTKSKYD